MLQQVRRVPAALQQGLIDDPELTEDLTAIRRGEVGRPAGGRRRDRARSGRRGVFGSAGRTTTVAGRRSASGRPRHRRAHVIVERQPYWPPTVLDARPPPASATSARQRPTDRPRQRARQAQKRRRGWLAFLLVLLLLRLALRWPAGISRWAVYQRPRPSSALQPGRGAAGGRPNRGCGIEFDDAYSETVPAGHGDLDRSGAGTRIKKGTRLEATDLSGLSAIRCRRWSGCPSRLPKPQSSRRISPSARSSTNTARQSRPAS